MEMDEAKKTNAIRSDAFARQYFQGRVIDIGAGRDLVCAHAERFDLEDGDANVITQYRKIESYDCVHSSHCLEHMHDPQQALMQWWALVKPGGYLVMVVPDEDLYEQCNWPSIFNRDHKATFTLKKGSSWSPVSFKIDDLARNLPKAEILSVELQDAGYNHALQNKVIRVRKPGSSERTLGRFFVRLATKIAKRVPVAGKNLKRQVENIGFHLGVPIDQTAREAVAQIQVIVKKTN
jgi:SAM-dependent methyltransferase